MAAKLTLRAAFKASILPPLKKAGFIDASASYGGTHMGVVRAACVKPYPDRLLVAAQFVDCRADHHNLRCRVWVVPWDSPDDGLERLQVGLCIVAFDAYEFDEAAAAGVAKRIAAIDGLYPSLRDHVLAELADPPVPSYRAQVYAAEQRLVAAVANAADPALAAAWQAVVADAAALPATRLRAGVSQRVRRCIASHKKAVERLIREAKFPYDTVEALWALKELANEVYYAELIRRRR